MPGFHAHGYTSSTSARVLLRYNPQRATWSIDWQAGSMSLSLDGLSRAELLPLYEQLREEFEAPDADAPIGVDEPQADARPPAAPAGG